jgi:hypothetical protein
LDVFCLLRKKDGLCAHETADFAGTDAEQSSWQIEGRVWNSGSSLAQDEVSDPDPTRGEGTDLAAPEKLNLAANHRAAVLTHRAEQAFAAI